MSKSNRAKSIINTVLIIGIIIFINILAGFFHSYVDLTEEKRYTLTEPTENFLNDLDEIVYVNVLLEGEFPAGFKRLQTAVRELLDDFRGISPLIEYQFEDPSLGSVQEVNQRRKEMAENGMNPVNLKVKSGDKTEEKLIYPFAVLTYKGRMTVVNLLENERLGVPDEVVLNNSISLLEYTLASAMYKLRYNDKKAILFTEGHGELGVYQTADLEKSLRGFYDTGRINLDSVYQIHPDAKVLIVAKPRTAFSEKQKFLIDQYVMNGGNVIFLLDPLGVNLDSMRAKNKFVPIEYQLNLEDLLFKYGARVQANLLLDLECSRIPLVTGQMGASGQMDKRPWYYHPVIGPASNHPIVKSLDRVNMLFPSTIDTVRTKTNVKKTTLLASSKYSRLQFTPVQLNFEILRYEPDPAKFNKGPQNVAVLLEGEFPSLYQNRVTDEMLSGMTQLGLEYKSKSSPAKVMVVSDGDVAKNLYDPKTKSVQPLGFNKFERYQFANKDFLINAIEYLIDDRGVINARSKEVKLRMLDKVKADEEKTKWQFINIVLPLILLAIFGFLFNFFRKRKYAKA